MSEHETITDIIAWLRKPREGENAYLTLWRDEIADRLEAAWKREKTAIEADALAAGGLVEASRATAEKSSAAGNCAKLREALEAARRTLKLVYENAVEFIQPRLADEIIHTGSAVEAALAAPARNCDLAHDWLQDLYCKFKPPATVRREMPPEWVDAVMAFCKWLVAQAEDTEGENDANK